MWSHIYRPRLLWAKRYSSYYPAKLTISLPEAFTHQAKNKDLNQEAAFHRYSLQPRVKKNHLSLWPQWAELRTGAAKAASTIAGKRRPLEREIPPTIPPQSSVRKIYTFS